MAPLAFLERMDRPWHWVVLSAIIVAVVEITYAGLLYSPTVPSVLPLMSGLTFALSYRAPRRALLPLFVWMIVRFYWLLTDMGLPHVWIGTLMLLLRNFMGPYLTAVLFRARVGTGVI
ncbi:MAG: hypothetical protein KDK33_14540, partial [Leptospiraceae bacterium]|nr:hypothetical protein [Leptospiraceae bacterium]